ncbi:type IV pili methyl-accepting chemotaxis transducer N-terminal domain-containing protein [uncultured Cohaesibacter sp.]|uniref:type IV pili methyl-accepting chemotaxis transducer N-terminal domain-containing protein n=1 Tax=uncultured Cohaesibacter sp. TaxID=1002546 RepID=UPI0029C989B6|nr:type IV pili methyl-accepting chemotaxis transducer N-terminal domain-containing protein [uncultured Cohaesibacter sp.]
MAYSNEPIELYSELLNVAGRQRMLSQRIGLFLLKLQLTGDSDSKCDASDLEDLEQAIQHFEATHQLLESGRFASSGQVLHFSPLQQLVADADIKLIDFLLRNCREVLDAAHASHKLQEAHLIRLTDLIPGEVLSVLQRIVEALQVEFSTRSEEQARLLSLSVADARQAIEQIGTAARHSKIVSLNARVAAGRAGPFGAEFSALSRELKDLADRIQSAADDVQHYLKDIA